MNLDSYCTIMQQQGKDPNKKRDDKNKSFNASEIAFRKDLAADKMVWTGNACTDFRYFYLSQHAIFSWVPFCGVPKEHPLSRKERFVVLMVTLLWAVSWAEIHPEFVFIKDNKTVNATLSDWIFGAAISIISGISIKLAMCSCVQGSSTLTRRCCERIGSIFLALNLFFAVFVAAYISFALYVFIKDFNWTSFFVGFLVQNVKSWFFWDSLIILFKFFVPCCIYQKSYFQQRRLSREDCKYKIHWKDYAFYTKNDIKYAPQTPHSGFESGRTTQIEYGGTNVQIQMNSIKSAI